MTTREELVALADEAAKRNAAHRDETGDMLFLGRPDDFLTSVEDALRRLASRQEASVEELARAKDILAGELRGSTAEFLGWLTGLKPPSDKENIPPEMRPAFDRMVNRLVEAAQTYAAQLAEYSITKRE